MDNHDHFQDLEHMLTVFVLVDLALFIGYLIFAATSVLIGKILCAVLALVVAAYGLWVLLNTKELLKQRSLWITCSFGAIIICTVVSLICQFP